MSIASPARRIRFVGEVESRHEADDLLHQPGDVVLVNRGRPRSLVFSCPEGCGSFLTINLDPRAGRAWRLFRDHRGMSLHPSVWRDTGCEAHFILWRDRLIWCGPLSHFATEPEYDGALEHQVLGILDEEFRSGEELSLLIEEVPWEITRTAERLARQGRAEMRSADREKLFRRVPNALPLPESSTDPSVTEPVSWALRLWAILRKLGF